MAVRTAFVRALVTVAVGMSGGLLPPLVRLEFEGRYAAMLSHEPKNYALLEYGGRLILRGVAFRSSRVEPFGETFLRRAVAALLVGDIVGVRAVYLETIASLWQRALPTEQVSARVRLTKAPEQYLATRATRREAPYEAMLAAGRERAGVPADPDRGYGKFALSYL